MSNGRFGGKVALVTGGASGIGAATVEAFAQEGAAVVIADINDAAGEAYADRLRAEGRQAVYIHVDVTRSDEVAELVERTVASFGELHCAANIAGGMTGGDSPRNSVHGTEERAWDGTIDLNLRSTWLCLKYEITHMLEHGGGAIVNTASLAGMVVARVASPAYSVAKAGIIHLTRMAAIAYAEQGIRVNCIAPGLTETPAALRLLSDEQRAPRMHAIPRMVKPEEQASAILWLCSDAAAMVTGHTLPVDGGWAAR
jgi:NAD(P)-dependent dehydrogenase (short-subunit alcohol dehydrogenase family)